MGRAAYKLDHAFTTWGDDGLSAREADCLDVGASTGGFTQVLLARGAARVTALDVGHGQLAAEVADDVRVVERSGTSIRDVGPDDLGTFDVVVGDLSFISLTLVLPTLAELTRHGGHLVLLVKPQFEVGRGRLSKNGIVTDSRHRREALAAVVDAAQDSGFGVRGLVHSPIAGGEGNVEYLLWARSGVSGTMDPDELRAVIRHLATPETPPDVPLRRDDHE
ncbi:23S rRNA (cytidine1920-2'-O)/16S rRNA (cytidine1409-2'-O)-methyltransferase [Knoellia remsis]|uniref:23S rRNA (Cytidine1920-2'-O)/16S rRNA (Cytidine1409-2'-O)-methyltransferase n=1 Tax=Knoellia remsis TaxID=407159 RepID=A0A2T0V0V8_9MICO|nr:23S rRNA (cytidine1920-2'-O)/16S rRNA (cytidine1409-2'-O)-methyltransferase [Knoellia remsis]